MTVVLLQSFLVSGDDDRSSDGSYCKLKYVFMFVMPLTAIILYLKQKTLYKVTLVSKISISNCNYTYTVRTELGDQRIAKRKRVRRIAFEDSADSGKTPYR